MGRYVTPQGVEIEMNDDAARAVGYQPAAKPESKKSSRKKTSTTDTTE